MEIGDIASNKDLKVLYDAAHAFGCELDGNPIATYGDVSVFSFHATKFFHSFEGGAIATSDDELAEKMRLMINFGFGGKERDKVDYLGINGKMTEISAAMGLSMLDSIELVRETNRQNFQKYGDVLTGIDGIELLLPPDELTKHNWQYVIATLDESITGISRDLLVEALIAENVIARRYFYPGCHRMIPYSSEKTDLPRTDWLADRVVSFPTGKTVREEDIASVAECLKNIIRYGKEIVELASRR
jgi:dTDP-4-amino-4,6-dideoxygalactose transaminase